MMEIKKTKNYSYYVRDGVEVRQYPVKVALNLNDYEVEIEGEKSAVIIFVTDKDVLPHLYDKLTLEYYKDELGFSAFAGWARGYLNISPYGTEYHSEDKDKLYKNGFNIFNVKPPEYRMTIWGTKIFQNICQGIQSIQEYFILRYIVSLPKEPNMKRAICHVRERLNELISMGAIKEDIDFSDTPMYSRVSFYFQYNTSRFDLTFEKKI